MAPGALLHPGIVVADDDPLRQGHLRVRVDRFYGRLDADDRIADDDLPWARPCFPAAGTDVGAFFVPPVGSGVWVMFWLGDSEHPVWLGGWWGAGDVPAEFADSYGPGPRTRIVRTPGGHTFEMRWAAGQEHVRLRTAGGVELDLVDAAALGGAKLVAETPAGRTLYLDDQQRRAGIETPTQQVRLDDAAVKVTVMTPGTLEGTAGIQARILSGLSEVDLTPAKADVKGPLVNVIGTGLTTIQGAGVNVTSGAVPSAWTLGGLLVLSALLAVTIGAGAALVLTAGAAMTLTAVGTITLTAGGILSLFGTSVIIGSVAGTKRKLVDRRLVDLYNAHVHPDPISGNTGVPTVLLSDATVATTDTTAS